ncbi:MmcQ/YjbR family DNA-binding protein [Antrihabitans spumae]|uniref:MmcQ/YjbR family DNA-binding protein n=1 Tax=Antrihabitans spumae TaxID=3373370 RepID=A0ABW7K4F4_9NOCA
MKNRSTDGKVAGSGPGGDAPAGEAPHEIVAKIRAACTALPDVIEERAWVGTRWKVRSHTFAHVLAVDGGWPQAYAKAAGNDGPINLVTFRSQGIELDVLGRAGHPFFRPVWFPNIVGMILDENSDWGEVAELLTESYCVLAPRKLVDLLDRPRVQ